MKTKVAIQVSHLAKKYQLGEYQSYSTLRDQLASWLSFKSPRSKTRDFWALKDISFSIQEGEVVGVIGRNGAGKSTLLKIISRITEPTNGRITYQGRVASLLEVGTGFSPELTGRENVYLNGSILGMTRKEITRKFDEIVAFSEVENYIDTPVKRYSSGMYVRLAFSVAAHLDSEILLVDEVLAVGDVEFQKKCLNKMSSITQSKGRTIVFISHNMSAIQRLCQRAILLNQGRIEIVGDTREVVNAYLKNVDQAYQSRLEFTEVDRAKDAHIFSVNFASHNQHGSRFPFNQPFEVSIDFEVRKLIKRATFSVAVSQADQILLISTIDDKSGSLRDFIPGTYKVTFVFPPYLLNTGRYELELSLNRPGVETIESKQGIAFELLYGNNPKSSVLGVNASGFIFSSLESRVDYKQLE